MYVNKTYATHGSGGSRMLTDAGEQSRVSTVETEGVRVLTANGTALKCRG